MIFDYLNWFNKKYFPIPGEFVILHDLLCLLKPLKELTVEFSAFKYSNCSILTFKINLTFCLIFYLSPVISNLQDLLLNKSIWIRLEYTQSTRSKIHFIASRFNYILAGDQRNLFMVITFLDYRFKNFDFVTDVQVRNEFKEAVKTFLYDHYRTQISTESEVLNKQRCPQRPITLIKDNL
jgi:hypothetical protein